MTPIIRIALLLSVLTGCSDAVTTTPQDVADVAPILFDCGGVETAFHFVGPDTIELMHEGTTRVMPSERSASGARYVGEGAEFWQKGDEAMLIVAEKKTNCRRIDTASR